MQHKATWRKGDRLITGVYEYYRAGDYFQVRLDVVCEITGNKIQTTTNHDDVEFNGWKIVKQTKERIK